MAGITAGLVKELREKSGVGMMDCKKALVENNGDIEASMDWLRAKGLSKAAKKAKEEAPAAEAAAEEAPAVEAVAEEAPAEAVSAPEEAPAEAKEATAEANEAAGTEQADS